MEKRTIVVTGEVEFGTRKEYAEYLAGYGIGVGNSVTKSTFALITNSDVETTKLLKARALGVPIYDEYAFLDMLDTLEPEEEEVA